MIENKMKLIKDVADALREIDKTPLWCIEVTLFDENDVKVLRTDLVNFLECMSNDLYWNEEGNWSKATYAIVEEI